jgi:hypothetical protein
MPKGPSLKLYHCATEVNVSRCYNPAFYVTVGKVPSETKIETNNWPRIFFLSYFSCPRVSPCFCFHHFTEISLEFLVKMDLRLKEEVYILIFPHLRDFLLASR